MTVQFIGEGKHCGEELWDIEYARKPGRRYDFGCLSFPCGDGDDMDPMLQNRNKILGEDVSGSMWCGIPWRLYYIEERMEKAPWHIKVLQCESAAANTE